MFAHMEISDGLFPLLVLNDNDLIWVSVKTHSIDEIP
jgi:hypothetical protein